MIFLSSSTGSRISKRFVVVTFLAVCIFAIVVYFSYTFFNQQNEVKFLSSSFSLASDFYSHKNIKAPQSNFFLLSMIEKIRHNNATPTRARERTVTYSNFLKHRANSQRNDNQNYELCQLHPNRTLNVSTFSPSSDCRYSGACFWHYVNKRCYKIPSLFHPLRVNAGETTSAELHCNKDRESDWKPATFWTESHDDIKFQNLTSASPSSSVSTSTTPPTFFHKKPNSAKQSTATEYLKDVYDRFQFGTSWLFREWKYWKPQPKRVVAANRTSNSPEFSIKASHRPELENLYAIENFCIEPFNVLSGYFSRNSSVAPKSPHNLVQPFNGKGEERLPIPFLADFFLRSDAITQLKTPPTFFDQRKVVFVHVRNFWARFHPYRTWTQFITTLGILRLLNKHNSLKHKNHKPLIVFINEKWSVDDDTKAPLAWGYYYQLLFDCPWAVITPGFTNGRAATEYGRNMFHRVSNHSSPPEFWKSVTANDEDSRREFRVCFKEGVVSHNCFHCERSVGSESLVVDPVFDSEPESYSFGIFAAATSKRVSLVNEYRNLVHECLLASSSSSSSSFDLSPRKFAVANHLYRLPKVYFALRTFKRIIRDFPLMVQIFDAELVQGMDENYVESINYGEPSHGSRIAYVHDVKKNADIFIGVHGGDFGMAALMPRGSILVEFLLHIAPGCKCSLRDGFPNPQPHDAERLKRCWYGVFANSTGSDHWSFEVRWSPKQIMNVVTWSPYYFVDAIRDASCRWLWKKYGKDETIQQSLKKFNPSSSSSGKNNNNNNNDDNKNSKQNVVVSTMWSCLLRHTEKSQSTSSSIPDWNQMYRSPEFPSYLAGLTPISSFKFASLDGELGRYFRFLWFAFTPGNIDIMESEELQRKTEKLIANLLRSPNLNKQRTVCYSPTSPISAPSCAILWNLILGRLLEKADFSDRIYVDEADEIRQSGNFGGDRELVTEASNEMVAMILDADSHMAKSEAELRHQLLGCLPTETSSFCCLYRVR